MTSIGATTRTGEEHTSRHWWGMEPIGVDVHTAALERIRFAYDHYDRVVVSFSGGKDSTAVLNTAVEVAREHDALPVTAVFCDEEGISLETEDYVRRVAARPDVVVEWFAVPIAHRNGTSDDHPWWWPWAPEAEHLWVRPMPPEAITLTDIADWWTDPGPEARPTWPDFYAHYVSHEVRTGKARGKTAVLMGIRADESLIRRKAVSNKRRENYILPGATPDFDKVYPIYDWTSEDVHTGPRILGWDYNRTYDLLEMAGVPVKDQRCAPPFGNEPMQSLYLWAECFPEIWDRLCRRVPGSSTAARYSRTELYAHGSLPEKPSDMTWPDFIRATLDDVDDPGERSMRATVIRRLMTRHRRKTTDPILYPSHPRTGVGWRVLLKVAMRGDPKRRIDASLNYHQGDQYLLALADYRKGSL